MPLNETQRRFYRELLTEGRRRFGSEDWVARMTRFQHDPRAFARHVLGSRWWSAQEDVGRAIVNFRRVLVRRGHGHGLGKTYLAADLALWFLYTNHPAVVLTTAPTAR